MNILSISQVQIQTPQAEIPQISGARRDDTEGASFADFLRDARHESVRSAESGKADDKPAGQEAEKSVHADERSGEIARNRPSDDKKTEENDKSLSEDERPAGSDEGDFIAAALARPQNPENFSEFRSVDEEIAPLDFDSPADFALDDKTVTWLMSSARTEEPGDEISDEDFGKMIDAVVELVPGFESEEEKLDMARNLAVNDPRSFIELAERGNPSPQEPLRDGNDLKSEKKPASSKLSDEKKDGARLSVHDLRTRRLFEDSSARIDQAKAVQKTAERKEISLSVRQQSENNVQMTMELASHANENITSSSSQAAGAAGSDFQQMLASAVQESAPDFVKAGSIILKDNNQGSINLVLRPEGLGNVRISLSLDDKNLSAQITVQTKEAMDAFRESIPSLRQAFTESGFETGSFDLNFSDNQQGFAQGGEQERGQRESGILASKNYGDFVASGAVSGDSGENYSGGDYSVNIVA